MNTQIKCSEVVPTTQLSAIGSHVKLLESVIDDTQTVIGELSKRLVDYCSPQMDRPQEKNIPAPSPDKNGLFCERIKKMRDDLSNINHTAWDIVNNLEL